MQEKDEFELDFTEFDGDWEKDEKWQWDYGAVLAVALMVGFGFALLIAMY